MILSDTNFVTGMINNEADPHWNLSQQDSVVLFGIVITY